MSYLVLYITIAAALFVSGLFLYGVYGVLRSPGTIQKLYQLRKKLFTLDRHDGNPIIMPGKFEFDREAVLNPAAVHDGEKTHLFYRAIGSDGISRIGYATSEDGVNIDERLPYPIYAHKNDAPSNDPLQKYSLAHYGSGGSWSGCEDARATFIDDRLYLTYNAFNGWDSMRVAMVSMSRDDLAAKRWRFTNPVFLSPRGQRHKNWVLFPEKINNKFALFHNLHADNPDRVRIEYIDDLSIHNADAKPFESPDPNALADRPAAWHSRMRSVGPPPLKTSKGWLSFYHAMDQHGTGHYKMGAMLLDANDPTKVIARAPVPVLAPQASYETNGAKPGIVYACGATAHNDQLTVYYGASDNFVCAARAPLSGFLDRLIHHEPAVLTPQIG